MRFVYDCIIYNGEIELLLVRLYELAGAVDHHIIVEASQTFTGTPRAILLDLNDPRLAPFFPRITHVVTHDMPVTDDPWVRERWQRNSILRALQHADPNDLVVVSDADEIPSAGALSRMRDFDDTVIFGLKLRFYYFGLNYQNTSGPEAASVWSVAAPFRIIKEVEPHNLRLGIRNQSVQAVILDDAGWHFSYFMDKEGIINKIRSFSHQEYNNDDFINNVNVEGLIENRRDLFERENYVWDIVDTVALPAYVQENSDHFARYMIKPHRQTCPADGGSQP